MPGFCLLDGVPSNEVAFDAGNYGLLDLRILRQACRDKIDAVVESGGAITEVFDRLERKSIFDNREIHQAGLWIERHGMPTVSSGWARYNNSRLFAVFVVSGRILDRQAAFEVNA